MKQEKIDRINALAHKAKTEGLTPEELAERDALRREYIDAVTGSLRREYIDAVTGSLRRELEHTYVVDQYGRKKKLQPKGGVRS